MEDDKTAAEDNAGRKVGRGPDSGTGAFAGTQHGGSNDGVTSAKPQVITGQEDASFNTDPEKAPTKDAGKDIWGRESPAWRYLIAGPRPGTRLAQRQLR